MILLLILGLALAAAILVGIYRGLGWFWMWLGEGKPLEDREERVEKKVAQLAQSGALPNTNLEVLREARDRDRQERRSGRRLTFAGLRDLIREENEARERYLDSFQLGWFHILMIFTVASVLGLFIEQAWMYLTSGNTQSRYGLVWGPFSPIYGFCAVFLTILGLVLRKKHAKNGMIFMFSMVIGGCVEQFTGWAMYTYFGAISWDYVAGDVPGAITQWVAVPFLILWGILGLLWASFVVPDVLWRLGEVTTKRKKIFVTLLSVFLVLDILVTLACFDRRAEREEGLPDTNPVDTWIDSTYDDDFMSKRFGNMEIKTPPAH